MRYSLLLPAACLLLFSCGGDDPKPVAVAESRGCVDTARGPASLSALSLTTSRRFLVKLNANPALASVTALAAAEGAEGVAPGLLLVKTEQATSAAELAARFPDGAVDYVEPDTLVSADFVSDDPELAKQWAHEVVHSAEAWDLNRGSTDVVVAILDSGVDYTHPDLAANLWKNPEEIADNGIDDDGDGYVDDVFGWNFVADNNQPQADDKSTHGTHVAGTVGAVGDNGVGISGHSPRVKLMALKFLGSNGSGYKSDAIRGIDYAIRHGAKIINNSWGSSERSQALADAIERARVAGILFVAAAGNSGLSNDRFAHYPSNYPHDNIVRVAASDKGDKLASFSNYGTKSVDLASPGVGIYSTRNGNRYQNLSGTSMATPLVSGVLATMLAERPDLSYAQQIGALLASVDAIPALKGKVITGGRVNAFQALRLVRDLPTDWVPPPHPLPTCR